MTTAVLASGNPHKLEELRRILGPALPWLELRAASGEGPVENGTSFAENALIKARAAAKRTGLPALADDSGISVDLLGGCPGIFSARWSGPERSDRANLELLLWQLADVDEQHRTAAFVCAAAVVVPGGPELVRVGRWEGSILRAPRGAGGFGYDPVFRPVGETRSAAELSAEEKDAHSHRTRAFALLAVEIGPLLAPDGDRPDAEDRGPR